MLNVNVYELGKKELTDLVFELAVTFERECDKFNLHAIDVYESKGFFSAPNILGFKHPQPVFDATQDLVRANDALDRLL